MSAKQSPSEEYEFISFDRAMAVAITIWAILFMLALTLVIQSNAL